MWIRSFLKSSIGGKTAMALTGLALSGFVLAHMAGNLLVFAGPEAFNTYSHTMQSNKPLLWSLRSGLLFVFTAHVLIALNLARANKAARPGKYAAQNTIQATMASRTMVYTGLLILAYVVYHLLHFTAHLVNETEFIVDAQGRHDAYAMVVQGFSQPVIAVAYLLAMACLFTHLSHGFSSLWQSLGIRHPKYSFLVKHAGILFSVIVVSGFVAVPIAVLMGVVK